MSLHMFIGNYLEPVAYFIYLSAVYTYFFNRNRKGGRYLLVYYIIAFILMLTASLLVQKTVRGNIWLYNLNSFCTVLLLGCYFHSVLENKIKKTIVTTMILVTESYVIVKNLVLKEFYLFDSIGYSMVSAAIVFFVFMYFHQILKNVTDQNIFRDYNFWLSAGYLIYFLGNFIIFLTYYYFTAKILPTNTPEQRYVLTNLWGLHNTLLFFGGLISLIGSLWLTYRKKSV